MSSAAGAGDTGAPGSSPPCSALSSSEPMRAVADRAYAELVEYRSAVKGVQKSLLRYAESSRTQSSDAVSLAEELTKVTRLNGERDSIPARAGGYFAGTLKAVSAKQEQAAQLLQAIAEGPLDAFVLYDLQESSGLRRRSERLRAECDRVRSAMAQKGKEVLAGELERLERAKADCDAEFALEVARGDSKKLSRVLRAMVDSMKVQADFHETANKVFGNLRKKLAELEKVVSEAGGDGAGSTNVSAPTKRAVKEGHLTKRKFVSSRVFLVLTSDGYLKVFKENKDWEPEEGTIDVTTCAARVPALHEDGDVGSFFRFDVLSPKMAKPLTLYAKSEQERAEWVKAIQDTVAAMITNRRPGPSDDMPDLLPLTSPRLAGTKYDPSASSPISQPSKPQVSPPRLDLAETSGSGSGAGGGAAGGDLLSDKWVKLLRSAEGNDLCADCGAANPEWASLNLGITICLECSGVHRSLGTHLSKVRSLVLDKWSPESVLFMRSRGNRLSNSLFEALLHSPTLTVKKPPPNADRATREAYIKEKYVKRAFLRRIPADKDSLDRGLFAGCAKRGGPEHLAALAQLLFQGADPNWASEEEGGSTSVFQTLVRGNLLSLELLLQNGAKAAVFDARGLTPLHYAAFFNRPRCLRRLLQCADLVQLTNKSKVIQPVELASWNQSAECAAELRGAPVPQVELTLDVIDKSLSHANDDIWTIPKTTVMPPPPGPGQVLPFINLAGSSVVPVTTSPSPRAPTSGGPSPRTTSSDGEITFQRPTSSVVSSGSIASPFGTLRKEGTQLGKPLPPVPASRSVAAALGRSPPQASSPGRSGNPPSLPAPLTEPAEGSVAFDSTSVPPPSASPVTGPESSDGPSSTPPSKMAAANRRRMVLASAQRQSNQVPRSAAAPIPGATRQPASSEEDLSPESPSR